MRLKALLIILTLFFVSIIVLCCAIIMVSLGLLQGRQTSVRQEPSPETSSSDEKGGFRDPTPGDSAGFSDEDLVSMLLTADDMPAGLEWVTGPYYSQTDRNYMNGVNIQFGGGERPDEWTYSHSVYQFDSVTTAQEDYAGAVARLANFNAPPADLLPPLQADEYSLVCTQLPNRTNPYCVWTARYGSFVVELLSWLEPEHLSFDDMQAMIGVVDGKVSEAIQRGGTIPWGQDF